MSNKSKRNVIAVKGADVAVLSQNRQDYICLTDIARYKDAERTDYLISNWLRNRNTVEFLGIWEQLNNPGFNPVEFEGIRKQAGLEQLHPHRQKVDRHDRGHRPDLQGRPLRRHLRPQGHRLRVRLVAQPVEFKLYLIKEFQRLKDEENDRLQLGWNLQRTLAKINYRIHTDAIKETLIPPAVTKAQATLVYASEADLLNVALFGQTAKQWRDAHPEADGNIRDHATARATRRPHQSRKPQLRAHPPGPAPARTPPQAQRNRHHPDAHPAVRSQRQTLEVMKPTSQKRSLIPKLRFPEFRDGPEWNEEKLEAVASLITERAGNKKCIPMSVTSAVGLVNRQEKFGRTIAGNQYKNYLVLQKNDFACNKSATEEFPQGFIAMYSVDELGAVPNSIFTSFRANENRIVPDFLNYLFLGNLHGKWLK